MMARVSKNICSVIRKAAAPLKRDYVQAQMAPAQEIANQERLILVNEFDIQVGEASKKDCHTVGPDGKLLLHRAFSVLLFNSKGELLLQKRTGTKINFPHRYTNTCCSHPLADVEEETVVDNALGIRRAAQRRLNQELGIPTSEVDVSDFIYLTRIHYQALSNPQSGEHEMDYILFLRKDNITLDLNPDEVAEVEWVSRKNFDRFIQNLNVPITPWFQLMIKYKLHSWWENLDSVEKLQDHNHIQRFL